LISESKESKKKKKKLPSDLDKLNQNQMGPNPVEKSQKPPNSMNIGEIIKNVDQNTERKNSFANPQFLQSLKKQENPFKTNQHSKSFSTPTIDPIIEIHSFADNNQKGNISFKKSENSLKDQKQDELLNDDNFSIHTVESIKSTSAKKLPRKMHKKAYTLVYQKDIEISFLLLAKKELQSEQTLKQIERIQQNELKIPKLEREIQARRDKISNLLDAQKKLQERKKMLTEDVVEIEQKDSVRATLLQPYREQFEDFKRKKSFFEKKKIKQKKFIIFYIIMVIVYIFISYPVIKAFINLSK
jgi:hypothetical protein